MISPEKAEEAKLKARYPNLGNKPGGSDLLRKRLQKGVSYPLDFFFSQKHSNNFVVYAQVLVYKVTEIFSPEFLRRQVNIFLFSQTISVKLKDTQFITKQILVTDNTNSRRAPTHFLTFY